MNVSQPIRSATQFIEMLLKTILNSVTDDKSFRFGKISFEKRGEPDQHIDAEIHPRKNGKAICSECGRKCPTYDTAREGRSEESFEKFFVKFDEGMEGDEKRSQKIKWFCSDMCRISVRAFLKVIAKTCTNALNILDRFHVKGHLTDAVNATRKEDVKKLKEEGREPVLTKSKYIFLKNPENLTDPQVDKLSELMGYNLRVVRAYMMKEDFERFWEYKSAYWAGRFLNEWCDRAMRSKIEPMKKFVKMIRKHRVLLMNWFKSKGLSSGTVEGFNNKVKLTMRKGYGFRTFEALETVLYHTLGKLPEPEFAHECW